MSETQEGYGAQSTPDMGESYPPQTGDLLGSYIARLSARVRELEAASTEQSAYQKSLEMRIERLESRQDDTDLVIRTRVVTMANNLSSLDQQPEPTAEQYTETRDDQSHVTGLEPTANPYSGDCVCGHRHDDYGCVVVDCPCESTEAPQPEPTAEPVCATCGHAEADHIEPAGIHICLGGTLGSPCMCVEYKPVATEG